MQDVKRTSMYEKQERNEKKTKTDETNDKRANNRKQMGDKLRKNGLVILINFKIIRSIYSIWFCFSNIRHLRSVLKYLLFHWRSCISKTLDWYSNTLRRIQTCYVPVPAPTRGNLFYSEKPPHFSRFLRRAWGYGGPIFVLNPHRLPRGRIERERK